MENECLLEHGCLLECLPYFFTNQSVISPQHSNPDSKNPSLINSDIHILYPVKILKIQTSKNFAVITLKFEQCSFTVE